MTLTKKGIYIITSHANNASVGRYMAEDRSLLPKPLFVLPPGVQAPFLIIEQCKTGYRIKAGGAPTGVHNKHVYAFLLEEEGPPEDWIITPRPQHGPGVYTIETHNRGAGWAVDDHGDDFRGKQIAVRPLIVGPSEPPTFPSGELWNIIRIDRED